MTKTAKRFRSVLCGVTAFLMSLALTLICVLGTVKLTALNPKFAVKIIEKSGYSDSLHAELKNHFISYGSACNVNESFFDGVFETIITPSQITEFTSDSLKNFYKGTVDEEADTSALEGELLEALKKYAEENNYTLNDSLIENLEKMSVEMGDIYKAYVGFFNASYFRTASGMLARYMSLLNKALIGMAVFALLTVIVIRLSFNKAKNYLRYYIYAFSGAALMLLTGPAAALIMGVGSKVNVANASLYGFVSGFINAVLTAFIAVAVITAVITAILALIRKKAVENNR